MNEYESAYSRLTGDYKYMSVEKVKEDLEILRPLVEKSAGKKPTIIPTSNDVMCFKCPNCGEETNSIHIRKYCDECGQKLDWSERL